MVPNKCAIFVIILLFLVLLFQMDYKLLWKRATFLFYCSPQDIVILKKGHIVAADNTVKVYQNINLLKENDI